MRLERYTKAHKQIPVGSSVAVQNQAGRFPNKWDKTGIVVENMDYDKVLVKLDGSGRLTTRNRQFVKKIISPPDQPLEMVPVVRKSSDNRDSSRENILHEEEAVGQLISDIEDPIVEREVVRPHEHGLQSPEVKCEVVHSREGVSIGEEVVPVSSADVPSQVVQPTESRPVRIRKPNVWYNTEEYDLSKVSGTKKIRYTGQGWKKARRGRKLSP